MGNPLLINFFLEDLIQIAATKVSIKLYLEISLKKSLIQSVQMKVKARMSLENFFA